MLERFSGNDGRDNLIAELLKQDILDGDRKVVEILAEKGALKELAADTTLIEQDASDDAVFFIITGSVNVFVNHHHVAVRKRREVVGEMAAISPTAPRSATVKAAEPTVVLKVTAKDFLAATDKSAPIWRRMAQVAGDRLRERAKYHLPANRTPIMFVGSSVEGLAIAKQLELLCKHEDVVFRLWTHSIFGASTYPIDALMEQVESSDFALFVFGPDDKVVSRDDKYMAPRDNVVFELGLFIGRLGRDRVYVIKDEATDLKIPSDLTGVTPIKYKRKNGGNLGDALGSSCTELCSMIRSLGVIKTRMKM